MTLVVCALLIILEIVFLIVDVIIL